MDTSLRFSTSAQKRSLWAGLKSKVLVSSYPMMLYTSQLQGCCYPVSFQYRCSRCNIGLQISICIINSDALFWIFNRLTINCQTEPIQTFKYVVKHYSLMHHCKILKNSLYIPVREI